MGRLVFQNGGGGLIVLGLIEHGYRRGGEVFPSFNVGFSHSHTLFACIQCTSPVFQKKISH